MSEKIAIWIADIFFFTMLSLFFVLLTLLERVKINRYWKKERERANIFKELASIQYRTMHEDLRLHDYPNISFYLTKVCSIISTYGTHFEELKISPIADLPDYTNTGFSKYDFCEEMRSLQEKGPLYDLVYTCSALFERIFKFVHPIKYEYMIRKKRFELQVSNHTNDNTATVTDLLSQHVLNVINKKTKEKTIDDDYLNSVDPK